MFFAYKLDVFIKFLCKWIVPFGLPVDPDEYSQKHSVSSEIALGLYSKFL